MPSSQLKQLKASLRDQGLAGPPKSKKEKARTRQNGAAQQRRVARDAALRGIRETFNPFDTQLPARPEKHRVINASGKATPAPVARPAVTKAKDEEARRRAVRAELQQRHRVGGLLDRRFGENDPTMTPEERALERFVRAKQRSGRRKAAFDLEDESDGGGGLTHLGQSLAFSEGQDRDDFDEDVSGDEADAREGQRGAKRVRLSEPEPEDGGPERPKTKQEVMREVIAKSKLYKYERQQAKDEDENLREQLDAELKDINALLRRPTAERRGDAVPRTESSAPLLDPSSANGSSLAHLDKAYDERVRQMTLEARSKPSERTKTDEELAAQHAANLKELEQQRLRRMQGETTWENGDAVEGQSLDEDVDDEEATGLGPGLRSAPISSRPLGLDDEDNFVLDPELVADGSDLEYQDDDDMSSIDTNQEDGVADDAAHQEDGEDEDFANDADFIGSSQDMLHTILANGTLNTNTPHNGLPFTYSCPQTHAELLEISELTPINDLLIIVQRIRALYHPKLDDSNKIKLARFSAVLVEHVAYLANQVEHPPFEVLEGLIRHVHSLAKSFPLEVGKAFRDQLQNIHDSRPTSLNAGDLITLTAIGSTFPTSDHFHQVATPAMLTMAKYLGLAPPKTLADLAKAAYVGMLSLQYQSFSKRYVPELVNSVLNSITILAPLKPKRPFGEHPLHEASESLRVSKAGTVEIVPRPCFWDIEHVGNGNAVIDESLKLALLQTNIDLTNNMAEIWKDTSAFIEVFEPLLKALKHLANPQCAKQLPRSLTEAIGAVATKLRTQLQSARRDRRPLALHHHRPLPIKTSIPRFEESYNPEKHYDPDRERAELSKLKAEHKKERKGVLREFRKDASFLAREQLRAKRDKDAAYDKKFKRLVAEIQGEEGREANAYEREKRLRKMKR